MKGFLGSVVGGQSSLCKMLWSLRRKGWVSFPWRSCGGGDSCLGMVEVWVKLGLEEQLQEFEEETPAEDEREENCCQLSAYCFLFLSSEATY